MHRLALTQQLATVTVTPRLRTKTQPALGLLPGPSHAGPGPVDMMMMRPQWTLPSPQAPSWSL
jgi:hypothetical protein